MEEKKDSWLMWFVKKNFWVYFVCLITLIIVLNAQNNMQDTINEVNDWWVDTMENCSCICAACGFSFDKDSYDYIGNIDPGIEWNYTPINYTPIS